MKNLESIIGDLKRIEQELHRELLRSSRPEDSERNIFVLKEIVRAAELLGGSDTRNVYAMVLGFHRSRRSGHLNLEGALDAIRHLLLSATKMKAGELEDDPEAPSWRKENHYLATPAATPTALREKPTADAGQAEEEQRTQPAVSVSIGGDFIFNQGYASNPQVHIGSPGAALVTKAPTVAPQPKRRFFNWVKSIFEKTVSGWIVASLIALGSLWLRSFGCF